MSREVPTIDELYGVGAEAAFDAADDELCLDFDVTLTKSEEETLTAMLNRANGWHGNKQERLDVIKCLLRDAGYWAYRGGCHVAVHYKKIGDSSKPNPERIAIFQ